MIQHIIPHVFFLVRDNMLKQKLNFEKLMVRNKEMFSRIHGIF